MRALTLRQPWATLIARGGKNVENRTWKGAKPGERIAIHAGLGVDREALAEWGHYMPGLRAMVERDAGRVVCTVTVTGYVEGETRMRWHQPGFVGWVLKDVREATSEPMRGRLGLWELPPGAIEELVEDAPVVVAGVRVEPEAA